MAEVVREFWLRDNKSFKWVSVAAPDKNSFPRMFARKSPSDAKRLLLEAVDNEELSLDGCVAVWFSSSESGNSSEVAKLVESMRVSVLLNQLNGVVGLSG